MSEATQSDVEQTPTTGTTGETEQKSPEELAEAVNNGTATQEDIDEQRRIAAENAPTQVVEAGGTDVEVHKATKVRINKDGSSTLQQVDKVEPVPVQFPIEENLADVDDVINYRDLDIYHKASQPLFNDETPAMEARRATIRKYIKENPAKAQKEAADLERQLNERI